MATFADIAGFDVPKNTDGLSFLPTLLNLNDKQKIHDYLYWEYPEYNGQVAVRMGKWKILWKNIKKGNKEIELYDLETDITEKNNIAESHPEVIEKFFEIIKKEHSTPEVDRFKIKELEEVYNNL